MIDKWYKAIGAVNKVHVCISVTWLRLRSAITHWLALFPGLIEISMQNSGTEKTKWLILLYKMIKWVLFKLLIGLWHILNSAVSQIETADSFCITEQQLRQTSQL